VNYKLHALAAFTPGEIVSSISGYKLNGHDGIDKKPKLLFCQYLQRTGRVMII
jgi:hypothetical protein